MNQKIKDAIFKQSIKQNFKKALRENKLNEESLYTAFVEPFTDAFKAVGLATQDIANVFIGMAGVVLTLDPKKQEARMQRFDQAQEKIKAEWGTLLQKVDASLATGDADLVAFAFAPGLYFTQALGAKTYNAAAGIGSALDNLGVKSGLLSLLPGVSATAAAAGGAAVAAGSEDEKKSTIDLLSVLFFGSTAAAVGLSAYSGYKSAKKSQAAKNENVSTGRTLTESSQAFRKDLGEFLENTGLDTEFEEMQKNLYEYYESVISEFDSVLEDKKKLSSAIDQADTYDSFQKEIDNLSSQGVDISEAEVAKIVKELDKSAEELASEPSFIEKLKEEMGGSDKKLQPQEIQQSAKNAVFADFKTSIDKNIKSSIENVKKALGKDLKKLLPGKETLSFLRSSKEGLKLSNMIQDAFDRYSIS